jgi:2-(1,2-epoxy-1,2-dihydrophenyl)acetyl-CoA isomerase
MKELVRRVYDALAAGDAGALHELLDPAFEAEFAQGLPFGIGGLHRGPDAAINDGWWAIGRAFELRAEPREWVPTAAGGLLVLGVYRGRARSTGRPVDAAFAHLWTARDGRLVALWQLTDTARWIASLESEEAFR